MICVVTIPLQGKSPMCAGKGWHTCWKRFLSNAWLCSPCFTHCTGLLKNLTEKIGTHTLFYDQKRQSKTTANNRHSFCRFCACAIWWYPNSSKEWINMLTQCGEQMYLQATWVTKTRAGVSHTPLQHGKSTLSEVFICPLCFKQSQYTCGVGRQCRHSHSSATWALCCLWKFTLLLCMLPPLNKL